MQQERRGKSFKLPKAITIALYKNAEGKCVAHALDFDLVSVANDEQEVLKKIRLAVKVYVEYGLNNNWAEDIDFPAPDRFWQGVAKAEHIGSLPPIEIEDKRLFVFRAMIANEALRPALQA